MEIFKLINIASGKKDTVQAEEMKLKPPVYYFFNWETKQSGNISLRHKRPVAYYPISKFIVKF